MTATLHGPWPTPAEVLAATYGAEWDIFRELLDDGTHGDWIASRADGAEHRAAGIEDLADLLASAPRR